MMFPKYNVTYVSEYLVLLEESSVKPMSTQSLAKDAQSLLSAEVTQPYHTPSTPRPASNTPPLDTLSGTY